MRPIVGIPCCYREINDHPFHVVGDKYAKAVLVAAEATPVLVPAFGDALDLEHVISRFDGLLVTGARSNVEPHRYGGAPSREGTLHDPRRDDTTLPLIRLAIERDVPMLAICRGIQELNVALGGTLHQLVHEVPGRRDHRTPPEGTVAERYAHKAHTVKLSGSLRSLAGGDEIWVNSLHMQGIDTLAPGLEVEAVAEDGQVEAVRMPGRRFAIGVQWHPEFAVMDHDFSRALFAEFGAACRERARGARRAA